jgi:hypothetical protein
MTAEEYLEQRLDDQIRWYDGRSGSAQRWFKRLRAAEIVCAAAIPVLASFAEGNAIIGPLMGILGALVVVLAGLLSLQQYQERWVEYRATAESLKHEKYLYLTGTDPYHGPEAFPLLVQRVEALISKEHTNWTGYTRQSAAGSRASGGQPT